MDSATGALSFRILGPVEASDASGPRPLGSAKQRAVLVLLLNRGSAVSPDRLIDAADLAVGRDADLVGELTALDRAPRSKASTTTMGSRTAAAGGGGRS